MHGRTSVERPMAFGVPQGSVHVDMESTYYMLTTLNSTSHSVHSQKKTQPRL